MQKPTTRKRPSARVKPIVAIPAPVAIVEEKPELPKLHNNPIAWNGFVRFRVPAGAVLECKGDMPAHISIPLGSGPTLVISGNPKMLAAINLKKGAMVQGNLTIRRSGSQPHSLACVSLVVHNARATPRYELQQLPAGMGHGLASSGEAGWCKAFIGCLLRVVVIDASMKEKLAA